eukprot:scaffold20564_cov28-Tisochrysis_lutea.AAC.3
MKGLSSMKGPLRQNCRTRRPGSAPREHRCARTALGRKVKNPRTLARYYRAHRLQRAGPRWSAQARDGRRRPEMVDAGAPSLRNGRETGATLGLYGRRRGSIKRSH